MSLLLWGYIMRLIMAWKLFRGWRVWDTRDPAGSGSGSGDRVSFAGIRSDCNDGTEVGAGHGLHRWWLTLGRELGPARVLPSISPGQDLSVQHRKGLEESFHWAPRRFWRGSPSMPLSFCVRVTNLPP